MKTIFKKYDKHAITALPRVIFEGEIKVIDHPEDVETAVDFLLAQDILGVDTETRPSFKRGVSYEVCLLQVSTEDVCFLFRLNCVHSPARISSRILWSAAPVFKKETIAMMVTTEMVTRANPKKKSVIVLLKIYCKPIA
uniref:hypothetical protein n=1 Tax=Segatella hominis TaxID=2518605 RepID=UPI0040258439